MKTKIIILLTLCFSAGFVRAQPERVKIPAEVKPFVEKGAKTIALETADINGDGLKDYVLVLERENLTEKDEFDYPKNQRPLLLLTRGKGNKLSEAGRNEKIVMCSECGGMMGDPFAGVAVGRNTLTVNHYGGSAWRWETSYKFNYSRIDKTWQLVRFERSDFHAADDERTIKRRVMTPKDFGKIDLAGFDPEFFTEKPSGKTDSTEDRTGEKFEKIEVADFNREIEKAAANGENWVKMPTQVVLRMIGEFSEIRSRTIEMTAPNAEDADSLTVTVTDDGFLDDSVRGEKRRLELKRNEQGVWKFVSAGKSRRCREGRGQQDFSTEKCL